MFWAAVTLSLQLTDAQQSAAGARELNPIMRPMISRPAALYPLKLGTGALVLTGARSLRTHGHPRAAFWYLVAINAAQGAVMWHNARIR